MKTPAEDNISVTPVLKESMEQLAKIYRDMLHYHANSGKSKSFIYEQISNIEEHLGEAADNIAKLMQIEVMDNVYYEPSKLSNHEQEK